MHEFSEVWKTHLSNVLKFAIIKNEPKRAEMKYCKPEPATTICNRLFLNHVHNQAGFSKPVINGRDFIYLGISKTVFTLSKLERLIFDYRRIILGSWKSDDLNFGPECFWYQGGGVAPKQRPDRLPSTGDHIQVTPTFEHTWAIPRHTVIGGS